MAEEIERYRAKINFQQEFVNVKQDFKDDSGIRSTPFFVRNIPFVVGLHKHDNVIYSFLICANERLKKGFSFNLEYQLSLITPSKEIQSEEFSCTFNDANFYHKRVLSEVFPGEEILVDDAMTLGLSLWVDEPEGIGFKPPKEKLRQDLQTEENHEQSNALVALLDSGKCSDVTFIVSADSSRVKAHKALLVARSDVFDRMLSTDMKEAKDNEIKIDDMRAPALKIMLHHIYTGQLKFPKGVKIDLKICQELANAGEKYGLGNLKEYAAMAMTEFVSVENALELLSFAKRLKAEAATKALTEYYVKNVRKILEKI